ncbi:MAG TPA: G8 domain-containing protein, partial [Candidatus Elarobacter sp.]|nr:G8 domain-containing protein [Candidatus Elarobacter sp.]
MPCALAGRSGARSLSVLGCALLVLGWLLVRGAAAAPPARWSDPATWGGAVPAAGATVVIAAGRTVVLDTDPPPLARLVVDGRLVAADRDVRLRAGAIDVRGALIVGSPSQPFAHRAELVLDATAPGRGIVSVSGGGSVELYGAPRLSWTHLAANAAAGSREIVLAADAGWRPGDRLALAPTGFDAREAEEVEIAAVDGARVTLSAPLRFAHWGTVTDGIDERAEIGLLSHNVRVRSESSAAAHGIGGQVVVMEGGRLRADGVEFAGLGRRATLGAYPVHFHLAGDGGGSFVTGSSIVHSANRCLTIHGTSGVRVERNVAFDTIGHCYFLEDGVETGNVLDGNLGMLTRGAPRAGAILESDVRPATFWIANPDNVVTRNAAAGSEGTGFWYNLTPHPTGPSATGAVVAAPREPARVRGERRARERDERPVRRQPAQPAGRDRRAELQPRGRRALPRPHRVQEPAPRRVAARHERRPERRADRRQQHRGDVRGRRRGAARQPGRRRDREPHGSAEAGRPALSDPRLRVLRRPRRRRAHAL